jgi:putative flavoprotein involved in K+ transport
MDTERYDTVVIGGGQAGLSAGYYLRRAGHRFVILDANEHVGDTWRHRYDSLRLFTPARSARLPGARVPGPQAHMLTKDEMADYLESYAVRFALPVRLGTRVERITRDGETFVVITSDRRYEAVNVVVASGANQEPRVPVLARELDSGVVQMHSSAYRNPSQLVDGGVLVVGTGNSGADIALELSATHRTWLSGPDGGHIPFDVDSWISRHIATRIVVFVGRHVLTLRTPMGRKVRERYLTKGTGLIRVKPKQLAAAGVEWVSKTASVRDGTPVLEDGRALDVANVIWCTGFRHDLSWIDLPIFDDSGELMHERGVVPAVPGLAFVGLTFQFSAGSDVIPGVARDARYVVRHLADRQNVAEPIAAVA